VCLRRFGAPTPITGVGRVHQLTVAHSVDCTLVAMVARLLIWNLYESRTSLEVLRDNLPELPHGDRWFSNESQERFGVITFGDEIPDLGEVPDLIGVEPVIADEFDLE
jgi:hypothetical protein